MDTIIVQNVSRQRAKRAIAWLRQHRSMLAHYDIATRALHVPITKHGIESTRKQVTEALGN